MPFSKKVVTHFGDRKVESKSISQLSVSDCDEPKSEAESARKVDLKQVDLDRPKAPAYEGTGPSDSEIDFLREQAFIQENWEKIKTGKGLKSKRHSEVKHTHHKF